MFTNSKRVTAIAIAGAVGLGLLWSVFAVEGESAAKTAAAVSAKDSALAKAVQGAWTSEGLFEDGSTYRNEMQLNPDGRFAGTLWLNGCLDWEFSGTWSIKDAVIHWQYVSSSLLLPDDLRVDADVVVSVDDGALMLKSVRDGMLQAYVRSATSLRAAADAEPCS